jgi:anti-sigma-K factor RskA
VSRPDDRDCEDYRPLLGAYALDALPPDETAALRAHVTRCPGCQQEVDQHQGTVAHLATATGGEPAPDHLWPRIAQAIATTTATAPATPAAPSSRPGPARWPRPLAAAALVAAAAVIALLVVQTARVSHLTHQVDQLAAAARQTPGYQGLPAALLDPTARHFTLTSTTAHPQPVGQLVILPSGTAYLVGARLPALPPGHTYQMWTTITGQHISIAILGPHPTTTGFTIDPTTPNTAYLITIEPAGGTIAPTATPIASAPT